MIGKSINLIDLPDGNYQGFWKENSITIPFDDEDLIFETDIDCGSIQKFVNIEIYNKFAFAEVIR